MSCSDESNISEPCLPAQGGRNFSDVTPATLHQLTEFFVEQSASSRFSDFAGILRLHGRFSSQRTAGKNTFAKISDDGGSAVPIVIASSLVTGRGVVTGSEVVVTGRVRIASSQYGLEAKLYASDIEMKDPSLVSQTTSELTRQGSITLDLFRTFPSKRNLFPNSIPLDVTVIHSSSAEALVYQDCISEISRLGNTVSINSVSVNMLDAVAIAAAIREAPDTGVLIVIRGGGNAADFVVFDDPRVLKAFAEKNSFRITGLGHTGNQALLDMLSDYSANTPTQAGTFVRESVGVKDRLSDDLVKRLDSAVQERNLATRDANRARELLLWALGGVVVAFISGIIISRFF